MGESWGRCGQTCKAAGSSPELRGAMAKERGAAEEGKRGGCEGAPAASHRVAAAAWRPLPESVSVSL